METILMALLVSFFIAVIAVVLGFAVMIWQDVFGW